MERPNLYGLIRSSFEDHQYVAIADTNHLDAGIEALTWDADLYRAAAISGAEAVVLEADIRDSGDVDTVRDGIAGASDAEVSDYFNQLVEAGVDVDYVSTLFNAATNNVDLVFPDERYEILDNTPEIQDTLSNVYRVMELAGDTVCVDTFRESYFVQNPDERFPFESLETSADDVRAGNIKREVGDKKALIIYGSGHFQGANDFDEMLGEDNMLVIAAIGSREQGFYFDPEFDSTDRWDLSDPPSYIYIVDEDVLVPFDLESLEVQEILANNKLQEYDDLSKEDFLECVADLPDELRDSPPERDDVTPAEVSTALSLGPGS